jgi:uncharacterized protein YndB with AHSA1/START domain
MTDAPAQDAVVMERDFDAPVDLIWRLWTESEHFKRWYGPDGATIPVAKMDVRPGGHRLVCMEVQTPSGALQMWFAGEYLEVVENLRLVYTEAVSDEHGNIAPGSHDNRGSDHPTATEVRVELQDLGGRTKVVLTHLGIPAGSPGAAGWAMALEKLDAYAATQRVT